MFDSDSKLKEIPPYLFYDLPEMTAIEIPASVEVIGEWAFGQSSSTFGKNPNSLSEITFQENSNLKTIGQYAFRRSLIAQITIPKSVETIEAAAFSGCSLLADVSFAEQANLKTIGGNDKQSNNGAFYGCPIITINIPASVEVIETNAFRGCSELTTVTFENESKLKLINGTYNSNNGSYHGAFYDLPKLELIDMSGCSQIEKIGKAFWYCSNLKKIRIGTEIPPAIDNSFQGAGTGLIRLIVPSGTVDAYKTAWGTRLFYVSDYDF